MITNILIILWLVFIVLAIGVIVWKLSHHAQVYPFTLSSKVDIPYITLNIQGQLLNMIIDTGCGVSIISQKVLAFIEHDSSTRQINLQAVTAEELPSAMVTIPFTINGKNLSEDFVVYPADDFGNFEHNSGITMHGLLGNEFLERTNCRINYANHTISLS